MLVVVGLIVAAGASFGIWRLTQFTPEEVTLAEAVADAVQDEGAGAAQDEGAGGSAAGTAAGVWTVDTAVGEFTYTDATGSFAGFRVEEELVRIGSATAVGRTGRVGGSLTVAGTQLSAVRITVDLSDITTNDGRRDRAVQRALNTGAHPEAVFELTEPVELGGAAGAGESFSGRAVGVLTVNDIPVPTTFDIQAQLRGELLVVVGSAGVTFADFDVTVPSAGIVARADDHGVVEFQLLFRRA